METRFVVYDTACCGPMRAAVRREFKNGSLRVEPFFFQKDGKDAGAFQGGHVVPLKRGQYRVVGA